MGKVLKKLVAIGILGIVLSPVYAETIKLQINQQQVETKVAPYQTKGTTLVPLRIISENLGARVEWKRESKKIIIQQDDTEIILILGSNIAYVNGEIKTLALVPQVKNGVTMVPIRFISENLKCEVDWNKALQMVIVTSKPITNTNLDILNSKNFYTEFKTVPNCGSLCNVKLEKKNKLENESIEYVYSLYEFNGADTLIRYCEQLEIEGYNYKGKENEMYTYKDDKNTVMIYLTEDKVKVIVK